MDTQSQEQKPCCDIEDVLAAIPPHAAERVREELAAAEATLDDEQAAHADTLRQLEAIKGELERVKAEYEEEAAVGERMAVLLAETVVAVKGLEPELTRWSWHDLPEITRRMRETLQRIGSDLVYSSDDDEDTQCSLRMADARSAIWKQS